MSGSAPADGRTVVEREVARTELLPAEAVFLGTGRGILPVASVDGLRVRDGSRRPGRALGLGVTRPR